MRNILAACAALAVLILGLGLATGARGQNVSYASPTPGETYCATPVASMVGTPAIVVTAPTTAASPGGVAPGTAVGLVPCGTPIGTPVAGGGQAQTAPTIELVDIAYQPNQFTIPANTDVTVTLNNTGQLPHTFDIDELNIHSDQVQPGQSATVKINAAAGSYQFYCREPGHKEAGMVGTLTVQ